MKRFNSFRLFTVYTFNFSLFLPITYREKETDPSMLLFRGGASDPDKHRPQDVFKVQVMAMDIGLIEDDYALINGMILLQDMAGTKLSHMWTPAMMKKGTEVFQNTYPSRPKEFHIFNLPSFFETMYELSKPFINEKMMKRVRKEKEAIN